MKEKIHTIPVNDGFDASGECPLCTMKKKLETNAIDFTMGPSYMEDDVRGETSRMGFCEKHLELLYKHQNRLGLALILKTHMDKVKEDVRKLAGNKTIGASSLFKKKEETPEVISYLEQLEDSCYICSKIQNTMERYIATIFYLYHQEKDFREKFRTSNGFCREHYKELYQNAPKHLKGEELNSFIRELNQLFLDNMERVSDDLEWFINKFDYRYTNEPWKNAKDALPRAMTKTNSMI